MALQYKPSIPATIGEVYTLLGFMMLKAPTFVDSMFSGQNVETVFMELNGGLDAIRAELGEDRFLVLANLSDRMRGHFEADPTDCTGEARKGRQLIQEMEAIILSAVKKPTYPEMNRDEMVVFGERLRSEDGTRQELDTIADRLLVALPHGDVMALLFDDVELAVEDAIDEALRRQSAATDSEPS